MPSNVDNPFYVDENKRWFQKWWPENVPKNVIFEKKSLNDLLDEQTSKYPDHNLIWFLDTWVSYKEFQNYVKSFATALIDLGIKKGDVVALLLPNCIQYVIAYYATTRIGAIVSGVNPTYQPIEVLHQLDIIKPKLLIVLDALYNSCVAPIIESTSIEIVIHTNLADMIQMLATSKIIGKFLKKIPTGKCSFKNAFKFRSLIKTPFRLF